MLFADALHRRTAVHNHTVGKNAHICARIDFNQFRLPYHYLSYKTQYEAIMGGLAAIFSCQTKLNERRRFFSVRQQGLTRGRVYHSCVYVVKHFFENRQNLFQIGKIRFVALA